MALSLNFYHKHCRRVQTIRDLVAGPPRPGEMYFLSTVKSFNAFTFVPYLLQHREVIEELTISTFNINLRVLNSLMRLYHKGQVKKIFILVNASVQKRLPKVYDQLMFHQRHHEAIEVRLAWNHSKITLIRTAEDYFVIEGSGNWSENAALEQYIFMNDAKVFSFRLNAVMKAE